MLQPVYLIYASPTLSLSSKGNTKAENEQLHAEKLLFRKLLSAEKGHLLSLYED